MRDKRRKDRSLYWQRERRERERERASVIEIER